MPRGPRTPRAKIETSSGVARASPVRANTSNASTIQLVSRQYRNRLAVRLVNAGPSSSHVCVVKTGKVIVDE